MNKIILILSLGVRPTEGNNSWRRRGIHSRRPFVQLAQESNVNSTQQAMMVGDVQLDLFASQDEPSTADLKSSILKQLSPCSWEFAKSKFYGAIQDNPHEDPVETMRPETDGKTTLEEEIDLVPQSEFEDEKADQKLANDSIYNEQDSINQEQRENIQIDDIQSDNEQENQDQVQIEIEEVIKEDVKSYLNRVLQGMSEDRTVSSPARNATGVTTYAPVYINLDLFSTLWKVGVLWFLSLKYKEDGGEGGATGLIQTILSGGNPCHLIAPAQHFTFEVLNDRYQKDTVALQTAVVPPQIRNSKAYRRRLQRQQRQKDLAKKKELLQQARTGMLPGNATQRTVIVIKLASEADVDLIPDVASFLIKVVTDDANHRLGTVEVLILLESPGGSVSEMGYAANQIKRLRECAAVDKVTVCVDTIAASGGYMMACQASAGGLVAAPFSVVGSIGVYSKAINYRQFLEKWGIRAYLTKSGSYKANLDGISNVTQEEIDHEQQKVEAFKEAFESWIMASRPDLNITQVATGEVWLATDAYELGLVDQILTSDEYITQQVQAGARVLKLHKYDPSQMNNFLNPLRLFLGIKVTPKYLGQVVSCVAPWFGIGTIIWNSISDIIKR